MSVVLRRRKVLFGLCEPIAKKQDDGRRAHALCLDTTLTRGTDSFSSKFLSQIAPKIAYNNPQLPFVVQRIPDPRVKSLDPNSPHKGAEWTEGMPTASMTIAFREYIQKREEEGRGWTNGTFCVCGSCADLSSMRETLLTLCLLFPSQPSWTNWYFPCISLSNVYPPPAFKHGFRHLRLSPRCRFSSSSSSTNRRPRRAHHPAQGHVVHEDLGRAQRRRGRGCARHRGPISIKKEIKKEKQDKTQPPPHTSHPPPHITPHAHAPLRLGILDISL